MNSTDEMTSSANSTNGKPNANDTTGPNTNVVETDKGQTKFNDIAVASRRHDIELFTPGFVENVKCSDVTIEDIDGEHIELTKRMLKFLSDINGLGLAAPQIGIEKNFFVFWDDQLNPRVRYNPKYFKNGSKTHWVEKCLTYGDTGYIVKRWKQVRAVWFEYDAEKKELVKVSKNLRGVDAQVFQHETDHLNARTIATIGQLAPMATN